MTHISVPSSFIVFSRESILFFRDRAFKSAKVKMFFFTTSRIKELLSEVDSLVFVSSDINELFKLELLDSLRRISSARQAFGHFLASW